MELSGRTDPPGPDPADAELPPHLAVSRQVDLEMENQEGRHLSKKEDGQRGSLCTDVGMSPLRVTLCLADMTWLTPQSGPRFMLHALHGVKSASQRHHSDGRLSEHALLPQAEPPASPRVPGQAVSGEEPA